METSREGLLAQNNLGWYPVTYDHMPCLINVKYGHAVDGVPCGVSPGLTRKNHYYDNISSIIQD